MGVVFSPEQIVQGEVPEPGAHQLAAQFILDNLFSGTTEDGFEGREGVTSGLIYGSATGVPTRRSDVDTLLTYDSNRAGSALALIGEVVGEAEWCFKAPVEARSLYDGAFQSPLEHGFDGLFIQHLAAVQRLRPEWSRNDPIPAGEEIHGPEDLYPMAIAYCSAKVRNFAARLARPPSEEADMQTFQRALEIPSVLGRKVLAVTLDEGYDAARSLGERSVTDKRWSLARLIELSQDIPIDGDLPLVDWVETLALMDREYSMQLEDALRGSVSIPEYDAWLNSHYRAACQLAHDISYQWTHWLRFLYGVEQDDSFPDTLSQVAFTRSADDY